MNENYRKKKDLEATKEGHIKDIELLKQEHEDKQRQSQKNIDHLKRQLEKLELLNQQQTYQNATLEQQLKELQLYSAASTFSTLTTEEFKQLDYRATVDFQEAMEKITDPEVKYHVFKYQKDIKQSTLHFRN